MNAERHRGRELAFAGWMLASVAVAIFLREPLWCAAGGLCGLGLRVLGARGSWTPSGRFGVANGVTVARLVLVAALPALFATLPRFAFAALVLTLLAVDALDGLVARARGDASPFGAAFDMETDALFIMMLTLVLWRARIAPSWVLLAGLWRYVYAALIAIAPPLGEAPRARFGRSVFGVLVLSLTVALVAPPRVACGSAAVGTLLVSLSFLYSLARSSASKRSFAASDQLRRGGRAR